MNQEDLTIVENELQKRDIKAPEEYNKETIKTVIEEVEALDDPTSTQTADILRTILKT